MSSFFSLLLHITQGYKEIIIYVDQQEILLTNVEVFIFYPVQKIGTDLF